MIEEHDERMFVAVLDDSVVGFVSWAGIELRTLYVDPAYNGKGIGEALHHACDEDARAIGRRIIRVDSSLSARGFYQRLGYNVVRKTFILNAGIRIPALVMHRSPRETTS